MTENKAEALAAMYELAAHEWIANNPAAMALWLEDHADEVDSYRAANELLRAQENVLLARQPNAITTLHKTVREHLRRWVTTVEAMNAIAVEAAPEVDRDFDAIRAAMRERGAVGGCGGPQSPPPHDPTFVTGEALDEALASFLSPIGKTGTKLADDVRTASKRRSVAENAARWTTMADPPRVARLLAKALWFDVVVPIIEERQRRLKIIPATTIHPVVRTALMNAPTGRINQQKDRSIDFGVEDGQRRGHLPPVALVSVGEQALRIEGDRLRIVIPLAAWLARQAYDRWCRGESRFDWIPLPSGRDALRMHLGSDVKEAELDDALVWLQDLKVGGLPCIDASPPPEDFAADYASGRGGRPEKRRIIRVGAPLAPMGLESVYRDAKMVLPPELRFFSPVLSPVDAPVTGDRRTNARQRDFYALGLGAFLIERREEYAENGGIRIDKADWRRHLKSAGIYHRSHQSLADDMLGAYLNPKQATLFRTGSPVLQETAPGSGVFRLGDDFQEQELVITQAASQTASARKRRAKTSKRKRQPGGGS
jgi:hypothetical protein